MITVNITFNIDPSVEEKCLKYLKTELVPNILDDGFVGVRVCRVRSAIEMPTFAVQFSHNEMSFIEQWEEMWEEYQGDIRATFGDKVLYFKSLLEDI